MGYVDLHVEVGVQQNTYSTDALLSDYMEPQAGKEITIRVRSGSQTTHEAILDLINAAGAAAYGVDINGESWFIDRVRGAAEATASTVGVEPFDLPEMEGVWAVCVDGDDLTRIPGANREAELTLFVLSRYDEYTSNSDLRSAKEVSVP